MKLPFSSFNIYDWILWIGSICFIIVANITSADFNILITSAAVIGVTSLIFAAKGNFWAQILMIIFSILYAIVSYQFRYWGEMITYLGMTLPMSVWSSITWFKNKNGEENQVKIASMNKHKWCILLVSNAIVTTIFYFILEILDTPNMIFSTLSITTSFFAAALTILRSSFYAFFYALNDLVLIVLWVLATIEDPVYFPVIINFVIFFVNDIYGFINWRKREKSI